MERRRSPAAMLMALALLGACSHAPSPAVATASPTASATTIGRAFGDSSAFGARVVSFEPTKSSAIYRLDTPAYVVLLEVVPGKSIELIAPRVNSAPVMASRGPHQIDTFVPDDSSAARATDTYQTCFDNGMRALTPKSTPRPRPVKRDSTGRLAGPPDKERIDQAIEPSRAAVQDLERRCRRAAQGTARAASARRTGERYLLMLATDSPITGVQIMARINTLTVTASDIPSTMEAIADGLFADRKQTWSGYYVTH